MSVDPRTSSAEPVASTESAPPTSSTIAAPPPTMSTAVSYAGGTDRNPIDGLVLSVRAAVQEEIQAALSREVRRSGGLTVGVGATSEDASTTTAASAQGKQCHGRPYIYILQLLQSLQCPVSGQALCGLSVVGMTPR